MIQRVKRTDGSSVLKDEPLKNDFSHVHDALQYWVVGADRRGAVLDDIDIRARLAAKGQVKRGG